MVLEKMIYAAAWVAAVGLVALLARVAVGWFS